MSSSEPAVRTGSPNRSPSYPQRVHIRERAQWQALLAEVEAKIAAARQSPKAGSADAALLLARMDGARDQIADAVRRLPMEVGEMYEEDHHRVDEAKAALARLLAKFEG